MFTPFFYILKAKGVHVSLTEWLTLMEALDKQLCGASLTNFYYMARMILVKSEADFDKFDLAFKEYFKDVKSENIPDYVMRWLERDDPDEEEQQHMAEEAQKRREKRDAKTVNEQLRERLAQQNARHDGGKHWIGTGGTSAFGNSGRAKGGIRMGGKPGLSSAFMVIGEERYRDFRRDKALDYRQFQAAFRQLRQFSSRIDEAKTELDLDGTIDSTCNNGGYLKLEWQKPRKNTVKLLLLFDSGGTMIPFSTLCNNLFQAVNKANHFKDVKTYYFHNCLYSTLYKTPECMTGDWVETRWVFKNLDSDYKVIIVGDAQMAPEELYSTSGNYRGPNGGYSGYEWLEMFKRNYKKVVWLNPRKVSYSSSIGWMEAVTAIEGLIPSYKLSVDGLKEAIKYLTGKIPSPV